MRAVVAKWGNSLALRIPRKLASDVHLDEGSAVELRASRGTLIVAPAQVKYRLDDLLAGVTPKNTHRETDWGKPVGKEVW